MLIDERALAGPRRPDPATDTDPSGQSGRRVPSVTYARWPHPPFHRRHRVLVGGVAGAAALVVGMAALLAATGRPRAAVGVILIVALGPALVGAAAWRVHRRHIRHWVVRGNGRTAYTPLRTRATRPRATSRRKASAIRLWG